MPTRTPNPASKPRPELASRTAVLQQAAHSAVEYLNRLDSRPVAPTSESIAALSALCGPLPNEQTDPAEVVRLLSEIGGPATMAISGGRFFGFVIGGCLPAAMAAGWLVNTWDQNAGLWVATPVSADLEATAVEWARELLGLPEGTASSVVTGATIANFSALAAARHQLLERAGWDVEADGLFGAPELHVVVGEEAHPSLLKSLAMLGLGKNRVVRVPVDKQGRMRADALPHLDDRTILCLQAGNVNTGSFDPAGAICPEARAAGAWIHVDGAFGLWAAASPNYRHLVKGFELADSWATDAHKWPNLGYDCGLAFVRDAPALRAAMSLRAAYLERGARREPSDYTPELSRRARGIELWAGLRQLGKAGMAEIVDRTCAHAQRFAAGLKAAGYEVLNEVVLNQVLVSFGDAEKTARVIVRLQEEGTCWVGPTKWQGKTAMRISVSSWVTSEEDVEQSLAAMLRIAR
ncbi:Pyridoxal-dependent decarboxylase [Candidatus Sulfotelmatomonas gaucii]|uniref:Pyridoxal-dependent decarboxylase n=1 Tax=Candidatus Sulfuritelmatomonas gaucii TaxID=2043161 RepID=A0A2N9L4G8_9BACT|nr:Pyridoxal-dependent decarboxylase [Candidatus Sulfotelmatomonas gaucii]